MTSELVRRDGGAEGSRAQRAGIRRKQAVGSESAHLSGKLLEAQADSRQLQQLVQESRRLVNIHGGRLAWVSHCLVTVF